MANLSKLKRERMLEYLNELREKHTDDETMIALNEIELELSNKKYGLVWEKHEERVDEEIKSKVPVFTESKDKEIISNNNLPFNFLLEGDNLHSLKLLEKAYKNVVDIIYIDPPYNRKKDDFIYDDNYVDTDDGFKHSKWLSFMEERLDIAYRLLNDDGVIFISIDDNEVSQLKLLCDSIFGEDNHLGTIIQNKLNSKNDSINIQKNHEYILVYRKQCNYIDSKNIKPTLIKNNIVTKKVFKEDENYFYLGDPITTRGEGGTLNSRHNLGYTVYYNPKTKNKIAVCDYDTELAKTSNVLDDLYKDDEKLISQGYIPIRPPKVRGKLGSWTWELPTFNRDKHLISITKNTRSDSYLVKKRTFVEKDKVYNQDGKLFYDLYKYDNAKSIIEYSTNEGSKTLTNVIGESGTFNNPKNIDMIKYFFQLYPKKDAVILDFFAGSGTTGQAVLEMNKNDNENRKFILCTNNQNNISEKITYKRISNTINGYTCEKNKDTVLFEKKLTLRDLNNIDSVLEDLIDIEEANKEEYSKIEKTIKDGVLELVGRNETKEKVAGIPANLKYYKTDYIDKSSENENYNVREELFNHLNCQIKLDNISVPMYLMNTSNGVW